MSLHVKRQMIGPTKRPLTQVTTERFLAGVFPIMPGQLVRPGKLPSASLPGTLIWFLTCVRSFVRFQMRAFGVDFMTSGHVTPMNFPPSYRHLGQGFRVFVDVVIVDGDVVVTRARFAR